MTAWLPFAYASVLIGVCKVIAGALGFWAGQLREQLALSEAFRPET